MNKNFLNHLALFALVGLTSKATWAKQEDPTISASTSTYINFNDAFFVTTKTAEAFSDANRRQALFIETVPLALDFLSTGCGLDNPALIAAMYLVGQKDQNTDPQELALRILEEANR